jgi:S-adenosylmethionine synthetase
VAIECFAAKQKLLIGGEVRFSSPHIQRPEVKEIAKQVMTEIGYTNKDLDFSVNEVDILDWVQIQSEDINQAVNQVETTAGDQGLMFGYATDETEGFMPLAIVVAQKLVRVASRLRKQGQFPYARPDMKSQVTVRYVGKKVFFDKVVMSIQHDPHTPFKEFKEFILDKIIKPVVASFKLNQDYEVYINPSNRFVIGGPAGDTGLTGRKIIVDTYGGYARHGGGSFSGKDPTKVDRSGAYLARYIALNLVAAGVAKKVEAQIAYIIGQAKPVSVTLFTFGTLKKGLTENKLLEIVQEVFFFKPGEIIERFSLTKPNFRYRDLAIYGHFGRPDLDVPWEKADRVDAIKSLL